eukprot:3140616-Prymnesium_polylepis.1
MRRGSPPRIHPPNPHADARTPKRAAKSERREGGGGTRTNAPPRARGAHHACTATATKTTTPTRKCHVHRLVYPAATPRLPVERTGLGPPNYETAKTDFCIESIRRPHSLLRVGMGSCDLKSGAPQAGLSNLQVWRHRPDARPAGVPYKRVHIYEFPTLYSHVALSGLCLTSRSLRTWLPPASMRLRERAVTLSSDVQ